MKFFPVSCLAEAGPKKILDLMNVPWLTRENVASHLSRLEKGKELKCYSGGVKNADSSPKDVEVNSGYQSPGRSSYVFSGGNSLIQKATEIDPKPLASASLSDLNTDVIMPPKTKKTRIGFDPPISSSAFDSLLPWNDVPEVLESKPVLYENSFLQQQPLPSQSSYVANSAPSLMEEEMKPPYETPAGGSSVNADEFLMPQDKIPTVTLQDLDPSAMKLQEFNTEAILRSLNWELPESHHSVSLDTDLDLTWLQGERFLANTGLQFQDYSSSPSLLSELPAHLNWYGNERLPDPDEYSFMVDQGLFIS